jgi:hypothetical protein
MQDHELETFKQGLSFVASLKALVVIICIFSPNFGVFARSDYLAWHTHHQIPTHMHFLSLISSPGGQGDKKMRTDKGPHR